MPLRGWPFPSRVGRFSEIWFGIMKRFSSRMRPLHSWILCPSLTRTTNGSSAGVSRRGDSPERYCSGKRVTMMEKKEGWNAEALRLLEWSRSLPSHLLTYEAWLAKRQAEGKGKG